LYNTSGGGNLINNVSTSAVVLADGQIGLFSGSAYGTVGLNVATDATPTFGEAPIVYLAQGTAYSANPAAAGQRYPLWNEPVITSGEINGRNPVFITKQLADVGTHSVWVVGSTVAGKEIVAQDNTEYAMKVTFQGPRQNVLSGGHKGSSTLNVSYTTPNYTALATQDPVDHLIQNLVWNVNRNSEAIAAQRTRYAANAPVVALAINIAGNSLGTPIGGNGDGASGTTALAANQVVPVINTSTGVRSITLTAAMAASIKNAAVAAATEFAGSAVAIGALTWNILTVDITTAGLTAGGVADLIMLVALDETQAYEDRQARVRTNLEVGIPVGFDFVAVGNKEYEQAFEGHGQYRSLDLWYKNTHGQRKYNLRHRELPVPEFASPIIDGVQYVTYHVNHFNTQQIDITNSTDLPMDEIVLIPSTESTLISAFEAMMNNWLSSNSHPAIDTV
jgi:hypothetical protein